MKNAGKTPKWDEKLSIQINDINGEMSVQVWDEDLMDNDLICEGKISLDALCVEFGTDEWYEL